MRQVAERLHVAPCPGDAGDGALAPRKLMKMQRLMRVAGVIDPHVTGLMLGFMRKNFHDRNAAAACGDRDVFTRATYYTVKNSDAVSHGGWQAFTQLTLDIETSGRPTPPGRPRPTK